MAPSSTAAAEPGPTREGPPARGRRRGAQFELELAEPIACVSQELHKLGTAVGCEVPPMAGRGLALAVAVMGPSWPNCFVRGLALPPVLLAICVCTLQALTESSHHLDSALQMFKPFYSAVSSTLPKNSSQNNQYRAGLRTFILVKKGKCVAGAVLKLHQPRGPQAPARTSLLLSNLTQPCHSDPPILPIPILPSSSSLRQSECTLGAASGGGAVPGGGPSSAPQGK